MKRVFKDFIADFCHPPPGMDLQAKGLFLCACELLSNRTPDLTFFELLSFAEYVCTQPVRPLIVEGRKMHSAFKEACDSPSGLRLAEWAGEPLIVTDSISDVTYFYSEFRTRTRRWGPALSTSSSSTSSEQSESAETTSSSPPPMSGRLSEWDKLVKDIMDQTLRIALKQIDPEKVKKYISQEDTEQDLLALGKIFEVLGHHARALMGRTDFINLVKSYVTQFEGSPRALPGTSTIETIDRGSIDTIGSVDL